jgi:hypothetical protein
MQAAAKILLRACRLTSLLGGTGILPVREHRLKTCAINIFNALWVGRRPKRNCSEKFCLLGGIGVSPVHGRMLS